METAARVDVDSAVRVGRMQSVGTESVAAPANVIAASAIARPSIVKLVSIVTDSPATTLPFHVEEAAKVALVARDQ